MALAIIVTLEKDVPAPALGDYAKAKSGKALARELQKIDFAARCCKVTQPSELISESQAALAEQMRESGMDPTKMRLPPENWHSAGDGLRTIQALIEYVSGHLNEFKQPNPILRDLRAAEALLVAAERAGMRFHFTKTNL
jgi:hypothetical protein